MQIDTNYVLSQLGSTQSTSSVTKTEALEDGLSAKNISERYLAQFEFSVESKSKDDIFTQADTFSILDIGYTGKPIAELTQEEASELISEDGFFGIENTATRIVGFVLMGAGDDVEKLQAGREGILKGFSDAEKLWGGTLPDISYDTISSAVSKIDEKLSTLGVNILDTSA